MSGLYIQAAGGRGARLVTFPAGCRPDAIASGIVRLLRPLGSICGRLAMPRQRLAMPICSGALQIPGFWAGLVARNFSPPHPPMAKKPRIGYIRQGGGAGICGKPWISALGEAKPLFSQAKFSTGLHFFSTGYPVFSTGLDFQPARPLFYKSLFLKEKKKERGQNAQKSHPRVGVENPRKWTIAYFLIHGLSALFCPTRGDPWMQLSSAVKHLRDNSGPSTGPRVIFPVGGVDFE